MRLRQEVNLPQSVALTVEMPTQIPFSIQVGELGLTADRSNGLEQN